MKYDYLIVGSGLFGATFAFKARQAGKTSLVIDKRPQLGGNVYCEQVEGINVHKYGAHIFHTSNKEVWDFVNGIVEFNRYTNSPVANYKGQLYNLPFNMNTFNKMWPEVKTPKEARQKIDTQIKQAVEEIRQDTVNKVAVYTQTEAEALDVLSVSSADCIREEDNLGNFPKVRKLIERLVNEHRTDNLEVICEDLSEQIELAIIPLQAQINQIEKPDVNQIETFNKKKNEINQKLNDLSNPQSDLRISINKKIDSERQTILMNLNKACVDLSTTEFNKLLENPLATSDSRWLGQQVYDRIDELSTEITLQLNKAFERIASIKEFEGLLNYRAQKYQGQFTVKDVDLSVPIHRQITAGMTGYGIAIAGLAFLSGIGTIAALATAAYVSTRQIKDVGRGKRESELRQTYQPQIQTETQNFRIFVEGRFNEFQRELFHTISNKAQEYRDSYNEALNNMQTIRQQINAAVTQQQQLKQQLNPLVKAKESIDALEF